MRKTEYWPAYRSKTIYVVTTILTVLILAVIILLVTWWANNDDNSTKLNKSDISTSKSADTQSESNVSSPDEQSVSSVGLDQTSDDGIYTVASVIDGDTIKVDYNGKVESVRFIGIDTPETVHPSKPVQCYGPEASAFTKSQLSNKKVDLVIDKTQGNRDIYGRLLRYIMLTDGTDFNNLLLKKGYARYESQYSIDDAHAYLYSESEIYAQSHKLGLWGAC